MHKATILAIGAHPDDIEFGCGGTLIKYTERGHRLFLYIMTAGGLGAATSTRVEEQMASKTILGAEEALKTPYFKALTIGFIAGFTGLLFHAIGANTFIIVRIMEPFWFFTGLIAVLPTIERQSVTQPEEKKSKIRRFAPVN